MATGDPTGAIVVGAAPVPVSAGTDAADAAVDATVVAAVFFLPQPMARMGSTLKAIKARTVLDFMILPRRRNMYERRNLTNDLIS